MAFSVPLLAGASETEAVRLAYDAMAIGADAIMCQWSPRFVAAAAEAGVPVQGHAGLVPRKSTWTGGLSAVGKTLDEAFWGLPRDQSAGKGPGRTQWKSKYSGRLLRRSQTDNLLTSSIGGGGGEFSFFLQKNLVTTHRLTPPSKQYRIFIK
ncbi:MAG: hypothetical protein CM1200mP41_27630 [Gammaproteobacteria bacterium]|nr:MAG: hypothetical protein CM1200mP41_27630 [Gammaproteobacteria bacterium]